MMMYFVMFGFVGLIWALTGLGEARTGVNRIFRELEFDRHTAHTQSAPEGIR